MDRFIDAKGEFINYFHKYLKSNMDRFIDTSVSATLTIDKLFKIQYGQIYRKN